MSSEKKITDNMQLIKTHTKSLTDSYVNGMEDGSIVLGNLDLIGWVIIKKKSLLEQLPNKKTNIRQ